MSRHLGMMAALVAAVAAEAPPQSSDPRRDRRGSPPPINGRIIRVSPEVYDEVLKGHTLAQVNAMPYLERLALVEEATRRVAAAQRQSSSELALQLREERRRRKAEAWAKRQPKGGPT